MPHVLFLLVPPPPRHSAGPAAWSAGLVAQVLAFRAQATAFCSLGAHLVPGGSCPPLAPWEQALPRGPFLPGVFMFSEGTRLCAKGNM